MKIIIIIISQNTLIISQKVVNPNWQTPTQHISPYDISWYHNWKSVFGKNPLLWFFPVKHRPGDLEGHGVTFPVRDDIVILNKNKENILEESSSVYIDNNCKILTNNSSNLNSSNLNSSNINSSNLNSSNFGSSESEVINSNKYNSKYNTKHGNMARKYLLDNGIGNIHGDKKQGGIDGIDGGYESASSAWSENNNIINNNNINNNNIINNNQFSQSRSPPLTGVASCTK